MIYNSVVTYILNLEIQYGLLCYHARIYAYKQSGKITDNIKTI